VQSLLVQHSCGANTGVGRSAGLFRIPHDHARVWSLLLHVMDRMDEKLPTTACVVHCCATTDGRNCNVQIVLIGLTSFLLVTNWSQTPITFLWY